MSFSTFVRRKPVLITSVVLAICFVLVYSWPSLETERLRDLIPHIPKDQQEDSHPSHDIAPPSSPPSTGAESNSSVPSIPEEKVKTSQLHYLIPASRSTLQLCYNLVSSAVTRYPVPMLLGWSGIGEFDAATTHLAKLRAMKRYLHSLPPQEDDDLVIIVDGYDIIQQLPPEVIIERYFDIARKADAHLAKRLHLSVDEARARNLRQTVFWGPDKVCFPLDFRASRCWAAPPSTLGPEAFGPDTGNGDMFFADPRWLNSGTVIGPVDDLRRLIDATMDEIAMTHDPEYPFRESDQYYISNVWGRQEYWRSKLAANGSFFQGGPGDRIIPNNVIAGTETELHVAIEYESALFQTKAGNEPFVGYLQFNQSGHTANMSYDIFGLGAPAFKPFPIKMPENVRVALTKLYDAIPEAHPGSVAADWLRTAHLGVNLITKHIYGLWHCTGPKEGLDIEYPTFWWYPFVPSLLRAAVRSSQAGDIISEKLIDGRRWAPKTFYPDRQTVGSEYGGAWSDEVEGGTFVPWRHLCQPFEEVLFRGEQDAATVSSRPPPPPLPLPLPAPLSNLTASPDHLHLSPPADVPADALPPDAVPPDAVPPAAVPPDAVPPVAVTAVAVPPDALPPAAVPPVAVTAVAVPPVRVRPAVIPPASPPSPAKAQPPAPAPPVPLPPPAAAAPPPALPLSSSSHPAPPGQVVKRVAVWRQW